MRIDLHHCYILHHRSYRETSLILDVFSREQGRISLVAKGAKKNKNNRSHILQPARKLNMAWSVRGEMGTLVAAEEITTYFNINGRALLSVFYINELLIRMLHSHEPHPELFAIYDRTLSLLNDGANEEMILRLFEKHLLNSLGYGLVLDQEPGEGAKVHPEQRYFYLLNHGPESRQPDGTQFYQVSGEALLALENEGSWNDTVAKEVKGLLRFVLNEYIGDRPLESRALYKAYLENTR